MAGRPKWERVVSTALTAAAALAVADLCLLYVRPSLLPQDAPPISSTPSRLNDFGGGVDLGLAAKYNQIVTKNIFSHDQIVPEPFAQSGKEQGDDNIPRLTQLPIQVIGTIVHMKPERSVGTLSGKAQSEPFSVRVGDPIPDAGQVVRIERNKVYFRNQLTGALEFAELKEDSKLSFGKAPVAVNSAGKTDVVEISENERQIRRSDLEKYLKDLPSVLMQARAVPRIGANGLVECYTMQDIASGSIFERLGIHRGDCIDSVNGERIDSPAKAMEVFQALRGAASQVNLGVERGGRKENLSYSITP